MSKTAADYIDKDRNVEAFAEMNRRKGQAADPNAGPFVGLDNARAGRKVVTRQDRAVAAQNSAGVSSNPRGLIGGEYTRRGRKRIAGVTRDQAAAKMDEWRHSNDDAFAEMNRRKLPGGSAGPKIKPAPVKPDPAVAIHEDAMAKAKTPIVLPSDAVLERRKARQSLAST